jgi:hypothetical protein
MEKRSSSKVKQSVAVLRAAYRQGALNGHPSDAVVASKGREVMASWGSAMRR